ncbi:MAG TPA: response regulator [Candidatus Limnocylindria bacterium]|nr:response regulator [Candidatus Limnocylindria bacterium]
MGHVLLIDDDTAIGELLVDVLADGGHTTDLVTTLEAAANGRPADVIVADLVGIHEFRAEAARGFIRRLRGEFHGAPIIVCTAHRDASHVDIGADHVITKPFDVDHLLACVERFARRAD